MLNLDPDIKILGDAEDFPQTIALMRELNPNVVVLDLHMPSPADFSFEDVKRSVADAGSKVLSLAGRTVASACCQLRLAHFARQVQPRDVAYSGDSPVDGNRHELADVGLSFAFANGRKLECLGFYW